MESLSVKEPACGSGGMFVHSADFVRAHKHEPGFRGEGIFYEEVMTTAGFGRAYSICYHLRPPTRVRKVEAAGEM